MLVSEVTIDQAAQRLSEAQTPIEVQARAIQEEQPYLWAYLVSEQFTLLTAQEQDYFFYLALVLYQAISQDVQPVLVEEETVGDCDEQNWALIQQSNSNDIRKRFDPLFENYQEEDLLAFVEDALMEDEEEELKLTPEGQELIAVGLKTLIDCLTNTQKV